MVLCGSVNIGKDNETGSDPQSSMGDLGSINIGDYVTFGHYEQDNDTSNGKEQIECAALMSHVKSPETVVMIGV